MSLLNINDTIAIVACSNGQPLLNKPQIELLIKTLKDLGLNPFKRLSIFCSQYIILVLFII